MNHLSSVLVIAGLFVTACTHSVSDGESTALEDQDYLVEDVVNAAKKFVHERYQESRGVFKYKDPKTGKRLSLQMLDIYKARQIEKTYLVSVDFKPVGASKKKVYTFDFLLNRVEGQLMVEEIDIQSHPEYVGGKWKKVARYDLEADVSEGEEYSPDEGDVESLEGDVTY